MNSELKTKAKTGEGDVEIRQSYSAFKGEKRLMNRTGKPLSEELFRKITGKGY